MLLATRFGKWLAAGLAAVCLVGCATSPSPSPNVSGEPSRPLAFEFPVDCGPLGDGALCEQAVQVALTAKLNPPATAGVTIRRPRADDACATAFRECGPNGVIVTIQSGDTLQEVPLIPLLGGGWVRLDLVR